MGFKDTILTFNDDKIVSDKTSAEVMMSWEAPIMEKSAEYICDTKGDILEIGFGMGICADYIQAQGGNWNGVSGFNKYDGIFIDTFGDDDYFEFKTFALDKARSGAKITYWNNFTDKRNEHSFDSVSFDDISVTPDDNTYFTSNIYHMPKVEL